MATITAGLPPTSSPSTILESDPSTSTSPSSQPQSESSTSPSTPSATSNPTLPTTTTYTLPCSPQVIYHFNTLVSRVFLTEPFTRLLRLESTPTPNNTLTVSDVLAAYAPRTTRKLADGGLITVAGDWAAAAIWDPPAANVMGPALTPEVVAARPVFARFQQLIAEAKRKHLGPGQKYWHLSMMARDPAVQPPVKGAVRAVIEPFLQRARDEGLPVWLEASSARARDVYGYFGFEVVEETWHGLGSWTAEGFPARVGEDGVLEEATGVPVWFLVFNREVLGGKR